MASILDTIDHAVSDWETSPDAMRWTPERSQPPTLPRIVGPTPEQIAHLTAAWQTMAAHVRVQMEALGAALKSTLATLGPIFDEVDRQQVHARRARVSHIRRAYGTRRGHR